MVFGLGFAYTAADEPGMKNSPANKTALGAVAAMGLLAAVAVLSYQRLSQMAGAAAILSSVLVGAV